MSFGILLTSGAELVVWLDDAAEEWLVEAFACAPAAACVSCVEVVLCFGFCGASTAARLKNWVRCLVSGCMFVIAGGGGRGCCARLSVPPCCCARDRSAAVVETLVGAEYKTARVYCGGDRKSVV